MAKYSVNGVLFEVPEGVTHFKFIPSSQCSVSTDLDVITFKFTRGITAAEFCGLVGLSAVYPESILMPYLVPTKISYMSVDINKDKELVKICHEDINLTQLRYKIDKLYLKNRFYNLTYLLGTEGEWNIEEYYQNLLDTGLFELVNPIENKSELGNVEIHNSRYHRIKSSRVYLPASKYRNYRICSLDYFADFLWKLSLIFEDYGFELVEYEKLKDAETSNIVTFKINTRGKEFIKRITPRLPEHDIMPATTQIMFMLMTPDTSIYEDFRMRYNNIDLIQNIREFKVADKYENAWRYDVVWQSRLDDAFAHEFGTTDLGTYGYQFGFVATLEYYDVYDNVYTEVEDILVNYEIENSKVNKYEDNEQLGEGATESGTDGVTESTEG